MSPLTVDAVSLGSSDQLTYLPPMLICEYLEKRACAFLISVSLTTNVVSGT